MAELSSRLSEGNRKDILDTLAQGSDKSKANYLRKIIDEVKSTEPVTR
jgi:predicted DNA-binding protein